MTKINSDALVVLTMFVVAAILLGLRACLPYHARRRAVGRLSFKVSNFAQPRSTAAEQTRTNHSFVSLHGSNRMPDAAEFRKRAEDCMELCNRMDPDSQPILLSIAEAWLALAERAGEGQITMDRPNAPSTNKVQ